MLKVEGMRRSPVSAAELSGLARCLPTFPWKKRNARLFMYATTLLRAGSSYSHYMADSRALAIPDYGMSIPQPSAVTREVERLETVEIPAYRGDAWMGFQDVMVVGKRVP